MDTPERSGRIYGKREEDILEVRAGDDEKLDVSEKRKHRSGRSRKPGEDVDVLDGSGKRRGKRSGGGGRGDSDEDDYEVKRESRAKPVKKRPEESSLERLSNWYQDGELEGSRQGSGGSKGHGRGEEGERRKAGSKVSEHESSRGGNKSREERSQEGDQDKVVGRGDSKQSDRKESVLEKGSSSIEAGRSSRRRWDEPDSSIVVPDDSLKEKTDSRSRKDSESKYDNSRERNASSRNEVSDGKNKGLDSSREKAMKADNKEERRVAIDKGKSRNRTEGAEDDNRGSPVARDDRSGRDKSDKHWQQRTPSSRDGLEGHERYPNIDEDGNAWTREKSARDAGRSNRSRSPERNVRRHQESQISEVDYERGIDTRRKDLDRESNREERPKGRDENWVERKRDWDNSRENWKRRQPASNDRESKDGDVLHDRSRDWEPRHPRDRNENERPHGRSRGEAVKTSSNYGISNDDYDVIEIQTKPLGYGRADSSSNFTKRGEFGQQSDRKFVANGEEWGHTRDERVRQHDGYGSGPNIEASKDMFPDEGTSAEDPSMWRDDLDNHGERGRGQRGAAPGRNSCIQTSSGGSQPSHGNHEQASFGRPLHQGVKGSRVGRGGRGRPGRDSQPVGLPLPIMGSPFGPLGMPPPGQMQPLGPGMSPAPGPPMSPGVFIPPFPPPVVWPGARGMDMSMLGVPPALPPIPPGSSGPRFPPNMGTPPSNPAMFFNQPGSGRGMPQGVPGSGFNAVGPGGRGPLPDKAPGGWVPPRNNGPPGKAPSRGEQNDYSQNFVDTGMRPQNFIRELELTNVVEDYPKLRELIQKKDEIVANSASAPMYFKCDLKEIELSPDFFGTKFDVILVDPPWEEYVHRAPGVADHMEYWTFEEILNLKIEAIADTPSFIFLWVGDGVGLEQGRQCLKKWGFRRCEDICWVKTNKANATPGLRHDAHTLFQHSKEHCLMGIKGTVRRSTDGHIIHANIDTDVIIAEEPPYGSTQKPEDMYRIVEHFALGRRRLELFGEDHNIRAGWLTVGNGLSSSNFNSEAYTRNFADKDGKVWQGGSGRNPPPEAPHLVLTTPDIEALRPKSPMKNQQQIQPQQSNTISLTSASSSNRRPAGNSPQNPNAFAMNHEASSSNPSTPAPWSSSMENFRRDSGGPMPMEDKVFDMYGYNGPAGGDFVDFESHNRHMNLL